MGTPLHITYHRGPSAPKHEHARRHVALLNGGGPLLTRVDGVLRKYNRAMGWDHSRFVNDVLPGVTGAGSRIRRPRAYAPA